MEKDWKGKKWKKGFNFNFITYCKKNMIIRSNGTYKVTE